MQTLTPQPPTTTSQVSAIEPDWSRERCGFLKWEPGRRLLRSIRAYQRWSGRMGPIGFVFSRCAVLRHRFWSVVTGADIPLNSRIGGGLAIPHPNGIVIHPGASVGPNCLIFQQVTLGDGGKVPGLPTVGGHVDIGAGAKILGGVNIGDHAKIGANAVVLCDVPPFATAVGVPARIIAKDGAR
jgi:serine O-acetyltransferase